MLDRCDEGGRLPKGLIKLNRNLTSPDSARSYLVSVRPRVIKPNNAIEDLELATAIGAQLGKSISALAPSELETLKGLEVTRSKIKDLSGLEYAINLTELNLGNTQSTVLGTLARKIKQDWLWLNGNQITDLSSLARLTELKGLNLSGNQITDLTPLAESTQLTELWLNDNRITDISSLAGLTELKGLNLSGNQITDLTPLAELTKLTELWLDGNRITDVSPLAELSRLEGLNLNGNQITDLTPLEGLINLKELHLRWGYESDSITIDQIEMLKKALPKFCAIKFN